MDNDKLISKCRAAMHLSATIYDEEIGDLISSAKLDLGIAGVVLPSDIDALCQTAIITYVRLHFGQAEDYDRLKASYDEQKAQLQIARGYRGDSDV